MRNARKIGLVFMAIGILLVAMPYLVSSQLTILNDGSALSNSYGNWIGGDATLTVSTSQSHSSPSSIQWVTRTANNQWFSQAAWYNGYAQDVSSTPLFSIWIYPVSIPSGAHLYMVGIYLATGEQLVSYGEVSLSAGQWNHFTVDLSSNVAMDLTQFRGVALQWGTEVPQTQDWTTYLDDLELTSGSEPSPTPTPSSTPSPSSSPSPTTSPAPSSSPGASPTPNPDGSTPAPEETTAPNTSPGFSIAPVQYMGFIGFAAGAVLFVTGRKAR